MKAGVKIALSAVIFSLIFAILFYARMFPAINRSVEFRLDGAFHYRMTQEVLKNGAVPYIDKLSTYPEGKNIRAFLPVGVYYLAAYFNKLLNLFCNIPLSRSILLFCAFCGSLIFIPAYLISAEIYKNKATPYLTAFLAGIIPAYLNRTLCYWYRYEVVAAPVLFLSLWFFIKAFNAPRPAKTLIYSLACVTLLVFASYLWRLAVLFLIGYTIAVLYIWLKESRIPKRWGLIIAVVLSTYLLLLWFVPGFGFKNPASDYGVFPKAVAQIILDRIGIKQAFTDFTRMVYENQELAMTGLPKMFGYLVLSFSGIFAVIFLFTNFHKGANRVKKDILLIFLIYYGCLTFIFVRNKIILGPLVALTLGETLELAFKNRRGWVKNLILCLVAAVFIKTGCDSYKLVRTRYVNTRLHPSYKEALKAINKLTPKDAVIVCHWADGYPIQTYCRRATLTDGLFESPEIIKRIIRESKIYYSNSEDELWNFCRQYGATHILVPNNRKRGYAMYAGVDYRKYYRNNKGTALAKDTVLFKLMFAPKALNKFPLLYRNKVYALFSVKS